MRKEPADDRRVALPGRCLGPEPLPGRDGQVRSAGLSYSLVLGQFEAGMKNTVELLTEKNNYLAAQQEQIQAKYQAVLSIRLLDFYRNVPIEL
ncbi:MAG: TolC family protein [Alistipes sp.]